MPHLRRSGEGRNGTGKKPREILRSAQNDKFELRAAGGALLGGDYRGGGLGIVGGGVAVGGGAAEGGAEDVVGEEISAVDGDHHDLELVGEALGDDFLDEHGIAF